MLIATIFTLILPSLNLSIIKITPLIIKNFQYALLVTLFLYFPSLVLELHRFRGQPVKIHQLFMCLKSVMYIIVRILLMLDLSLFLSYYDFPVEFFRSVIILLFLVGYPLVKLIFFDPENGVPILLVGLIPLTIVLFLLMASSTPMYSPPNRETTFSEAFLTRLFLLSIVGIVICIIYLIVKNAKKWFKNAKESIKKGVQSLFLPDTFDISTNK